MLHLFVFHIAYDGSLLDDETEEYELQTQAILGVEANHLEEALGIAKRIHPGCDHYSLKYCSNVNRRGDPAIVFDI